MRRDAFPAPRLVSYSSPPPSSRRAAAAAAAAVVEWETWVGSMEIFFELVLTAALSLVVSFFLAKLLSVAAGSSDPRGESVGGQAEGGKSGPGLEGEERRVLEDRKIRVVAPSVVEVKEVDEGEGVGRVELLERVLDDEKDKAEGGLVSVSAVKEPEEVVVEGGGVISGRELGEEMEKDRVEDLGVIRSEANLGERVEKGEIGENDGGEVIGNEGAEKGGGVEREKLLFDEDDWEGIEKSDLERRFGVVSGMVASDEGGVLEKVGSDVHMQLYALHKIATEGPCYEPQPSVLKSSARAKWNAWQQLGNMNPDSAMEQYITLVSESIPDWNESISTKQEERIVSPGKVGGEEDPDLSSSQGHHLDSAIERNPDTIPEAETIETRPSDADDGAKFSEQGHAS
ncbi:hypothetical protein H6P81_018492 [Aristolochia fimbriata]|uniref:ACB domain-containing protein n=1 Tax=Aristolochia fimbriata TaxID=158543 RepID=A0AAV7E5H7_ARIFI|nr:hypothetical protein H6P81_018492 [Aristolochia fimbriata]